MNGFVSYRSIDLPIVEALEEYLEQEIDLDYWDASNVPGDPDWESIEDWIQEADLVIVVVTSNSIEQSISVGQEVGIARANDKIIIPLVAKDVSPSRLGFLKGTTAVRFDPADPTPAFDRLAEVIIEIHRGNWRDGLILAGLATGAMAWWKKHQKSKNDAGDRYL